MRNYGDKHMQPLIQWESMRSAILAGDMERQSHRFVVYRLGEDICAKCRRPRKEHLPEDRRR